jgi:hypothetical protein
VIVLWLILPFLGWGLMIVVMICSFYPGGKICVSSGVILGCLLFLWAIALVMGYLRSEDYE